MSDTFVEPSTPTDSDSETSLSDHEAQFSRPEGQPPSQQAGPDDDNDEDSALTETAEAKAARERGDDGRFVRHRAQSQKASAADVPEIQALTKELRTNEQELAKLDPDALAGSPRLRSLKRQNEAVKAKLEALKAPKQTEQPASRSAAAPVAESFDGVEPKLEDYRDGGKYADATEAFVAYMRDLTAFDLQKKEHDGKQAQAQHEQQTARITKFNDAEPEFVAKTPDYQVKTAPLLNRELTPLLLEALISHDKPKSVLYYLAQHLDELDELVLLTDQKNVTDASVAVVQRRLSQRVQDASQPDRPSPPSTFIPPRPPNPVRTGPLRTGEQLPGDDASLAEHERAYHKRRGSR